MPSDTVPEILLLCLEFEVFLDEMYSSLFDKLTQSATLQRAKTADEAVRYLETHTPKAIIISDKGLADSKNGRALGKVRSYVESGGLVIVGLLFPSFTPMDVFDAFFTDSFGVHWLHGDYHRTTFQFNPSCALPACASMELFPPPYSMKALHVKNAPDHGRIYAPGWGATTQSHVFAAEEVDEAQAAVVGTKVADGFLVYIGDVNAEQGSDMVVLALCGL